MTRASSRSEGILQFAKKSRKELYIKREGGVIIYVIYGKAGKLRVQQM